MLRLLPMTLLLACAHQTPTATPARFDGGPRAVKVVADDVACQDLRSVFATTLVDSRLWSVVTEAPTLLRLVHCQTEVRTAVESRGKGEDLEHRITVIGETWVSLDVEGSAGVQSLHATADGRSRSEWLPDASESPKQTREVEDSLMRAVAADLAAQLDPGTAWLEQAPGPAFASEP